MISRTKREDTAGRARRSARQAAWTALALSLAAVLLMPAGAAWAQAGLRVQLSPARAHVLPGGEVRFAATVYDVDGSVVEAEVRWSVIPPRLGRVTDGLFEAGGAEGRGIVRVVAAFAGLSGSGHAVVDVGAEPPGRLSVVLRPPRVSLEPLGEQQFEAVVTDPGTGSEVEADITWSVVPEDLGTIDESGYFAAGESDGTGRVVARAYADGRQGLGDAGVVVGETSPAGVRVSVLPRHAVVQPGGEVDFEATVTNESGEAVEADVRWTVVPARLGIVGTDGLFVAGPEEMMGRIVATVHTEAGPARGFASVEIRRTGPGGVRLRVRPHDVALGPGGDAQFEAELVGPDGEPLEVPVEWRVRPEWLGTITADGLFVASEEFPEPPVNGLWVGGVVASLETPDGTVSDVARVRVREDGPPRRLRIRPNRVAVAPGDEVEFEAIVIGAGDLNDWTTEWAVFPENLGTITPDGIFTANPAFGDPNSGEFGSHEGIVGARVTFADGSTLTDRAHVHVRIPGHPVRILVRPGFAIVPPNESQQFEAEVMGPDGQTIDYPVVWRVAPNHLGTITPDGVFTANDLNIDGGSWQRPHGQVVAEVTIGGGHVFRGVAAVVIDLADPELFVTVSPKSTTLEPGQSFQFDVEVRNAAGDPVGLPVEWRVADAAIGSIAPDGTFTASEWISPGQERRTRVIAGVTQGGRIYWDFATVRVSGN